MPKYKASKISLVLIFLIFTLLLSITTVVISLKNKKVEEKDILAKLQTCQPFKMKIKRNALKELFLDCCNKV